ncbi:MAG TPA: hypothetical protein VHR41_16695 [Gemmatimonadales bacterium]|nr:hypothetical protein [Gemmatimonadales bacterium]
MKRRAGRVIGAGAATVALAGLGYVGMTWLRYGKRTSVLGRPDPLVDRFMPTYEVRELHETKVAAPADMTYTAARDLDLQRSGLVRAIFRGRELLMGAQPPRGRVQQTFLSEALALGWRMLADEPGHELVMGAVTQPWEANVVFRGLPPDEFADFHQPGYAKIVWTMKVDPTGLDSSIFSTETRVATTDPHSRERFRRYWSLLSPGILLIRREILRLVREDAGRRLRARLTLQAGGAVISSSPSEG